MHVIIEMECKNIQVIFFWHNHRYLWLWNIKREWELGETQFKRRQIKTCSLFSVKALQKTEFTKLFVFTSFRIVQLPKFGNFAKISVFFNLQKFRENSLEISLGQKQGFPNIPNLKNIWNLFYSKLSKKFEKIMLKLNFENHEKLIPTRIPTRTFKFKLGMRGLIFCNSMYSNI